MSWTAKWTKGDRAECRMGSNGVEVWCPGTVVRVGETAVVVALDANPSLELAQGTRYWATGSGGMTTGGMPSDIRRPEPIPVAATAPRENHLHDADIAPGQRWVFCPDGEEMGPEHDSVVAWLSGPTASDLSAPVIVAHARPDDPALVRWDRVTFLYKHRRQRRPEELEQGLASGVALQAAAAGPHATTPVARLELATEPVEVAERVEGHCAAQMARLAAYWATKVPGYNGADLVGDVIAHIEEVTNGWVRLGEASDGNPTVRAGATDLEAMGSDLLDHIDALTEELDRLHTWRGLMELIDTHYPADIFDGSSGDPGPRIIVLMRAVDSMRAVVEAAREVSLGPEGCITEPPCNACPFCRLRIALTRMETT